MKIRTMATIGVTLGGLLAGACAIAQKPFGGADSVAYSQDLWAALEDANLAGEGAYQAVPYEGQHPHGAILQTLEGELTVDGHTGEVIVKRNYGGEGVSESKVANNPRQYLGAVTVMFRRAPGYDPDNANWFWVKYKPDGTLHTNPKGMKLAGRVAKGADKGCIACHQNAPGGDYVYNNDRY
ncbi:MAG: cytochrome P460 family protein [Halofilum sp. (in: g-proteobacteria)]|nr:cytochrome P460 family protein [Halofilum sp. (in: g-proteobacteria)]